MKVGDGGGKIGPFTLASLSPLRKGDAHRIKLSGLNEEHSSTVPCTQRVLRNDTLIPAAAKGNKESMSPWGGAYCLGQRFSIFTTRLFRTCST